MVFTCDLLGFVNMWVVLQLHPGNIYKTTLSYGPEMSDMRCREDLHPGRILVYKSVRFQSSAVNILTSLAVKRGKER